MTTVVSVAVHRLLSRLARVSENGTPTSFVARCPAHEDTGAALHVREGRDGRVLFHCDAGCDKSVILERVGLPWAATYPGGPRPAVQAAPDIPGDATDATDATDLDRVADVLGAIADRRPVLLAASTEDAARLRALGYVATASTGPARSWRDAFGAVLAGGDVSVVHGPDAMAWASQAAAGCAAGGASVRVVAFDTPLSAWLSADDALDTFDAALDAAPLWRPARPTTGRWRLSELWADETIMRPPVAVVPRLAWAQRATLLAAREKAGKSTLCGFITAAVSRGSDFLGQPCHGGQPGDVLIVGLEEFIGDTARRLKEFGADGDRVHLVDVLPGDPASRLQQVRVHVEGTRPALVLIDTLFAYASGAITDAGQSAQMGPLVQALTDLAHEFGCAIVILHHSKKNGDGYRDSSAIGGAVDVIAEMSSPDEATDPSSTRRQLRVRGRVPVQDVAIRWTGYTYLAHLAAPLPLDERVIADVTQHPGTSQNQVCQRLSGRAADVRATLTRLVDAGRLVDQGAGDQHRCRVASSTRTMWDEVEP